MTGLLILVVDDDAGSAHGVAHMLREDGFRVEVAVDGAGAIGRLSRAPLPDILLTELRLPGADGESVARYARSLDAEIPVFLVTRYPDLGSAGLRLWTPPPVVITKPYAYDDLAKMLRGLPVRGEAPGRMLTESHAALLKLFAIVMSRFEDDDPGETQAAWVLFESALVGHMDAEELIIFPRFRASHPSEASALSADHVEFRARVDELGIAVELHALRADAAKALVDQLTAHARREDGCLYPWAEANLDRETCVRLHDKLAVKLPS